MATSDDFSGTGLGESWSFRGQSGSGAALTSDGQDSVLELTTPDGNYDFWGAATHAARVLQDTADEDFALRARFLSTPSQKFQMQGFLVEEDANDWLRVDTYWNGTGLRLFAAKTVAGVSSVLFDIAVPGNVAPYLSLVRTGDVWTVATSLDGETWTTARQFTHAMSVTAAGLLAGNSGDANGFTARVDWFEVASDPLTVEDGVSLNAAPEAVDDALAVAADAATVIAVADLLANDGDAEGDPLTLAVTGQPAHGTLTDNGDGTLTYTPQAGFQGLDAFVYTASDATGSDTATVTLTVGEASLFSDDFAGGGLSGGWSFAGPAGTSHALAQSGEDGVLRLVTPDGNHDIWNVNNAARVMQHAPDGDMVLTARFLSTPSAGYQMQGFLVEADAQNWLRADVYSNGSTLYVYAAVTVGGTSAARLNVPVQGPADHLRLVRDGDTWTVQYSGDGTSWTTAGSFTHALEVANVGLFGGNTGAAKGFVAEVDWFEVSGDPLLVEDGIARNTAPQAGADAVATDAGTAIVIDIADLLANDTDADGDTLVLQSVGQPGAGTLVDNGDGTLTYTPAASYTGKDTFTYVVSDGTVGVTGEVTVTVGSPALLSDDFSEAELPANWRFEGRAGGSLSLGTDAADAFLSIATAAGGNDPWNTNNAARAMQSAPDEDLVLEARFLSRPTEKFQMQGFLVEEDAGNWIRFDTYFDGAKLHAFAAVTVDGRSAARFDVVVPGGTAPYLRLVRDGDTWTLSHSTDGEHWTAAGSFTHALEVTAAGLFAANAGGSQGFTAQVDYFEVASDPLTAEDGAYLPPNVAPVAGDDVLAAASDTALTFTAADLLGNDTDANHDTLRIVAIGTPAHGTLTDNGDGTYTYLSAAGHVGADAFSYTVSDGVLTDTGTVSVTVTPPPAPAVSDDFFADALDPVWQIAGPSVTLADGTRDALLELSTPAGDFDLWGTKLNASRAMQAVVDDDFQLVARFVSTPQQNAEMQGFLVEEDARNWLRFDILSNGTSLRAFAAVTVDGRSTAKFSVPIPEGAAPYLRLTREGDVFTFEHSRDGQTWTLAGSFTHAAEVGRVGLFGASTLGSDGFTAQVDYFENTAAPLTGEDAGYVPPNLAPVATDDSLKAAVDTPRIIDVAAELLDDDTDPNGTALELSGFTQPAHGTLVDLGDGRLQYTPDAGYVGPDGFTYTVSDGELTASADVSVSVVVPPAPAASDDFSDGVLGPEWVYSGITGSATIASKGDESYLVIHSPYGEKVSASDVMTTPRLLQQVPDEDFQLSAGFLSQPTQRYQEHGFLIVEDEANWLRFDVAYTGGTQTLIVGSIVDGKTTYPLFQSIPFGSVTDMRVTRSGDTFVFETSSDGVSWQTRFTLDRDMEVNEAGLFAGSTSFSGPVPGYAARVDYFENSAAPLQDEDGTIVPVNAAPVAVPDAFEVGADAPFTLAPGVLLANDLDFNDDALSVTAVDGPAHGTVVLSGNGSIVYTPAAGFQGPDSFTYTVSDGALTSEGTVDLYVGTPIDVWYGEEQTFGAPGEAQRWVNILGNVGDVVTSLSYSLNGGAERQLSLGPDTRRLNADGDFNIDIDFADLDGSAADDTVTIIARSASGQLWTRDVLVHYEAGAHYGPDYTIDWGTAGAVSDVAQVVDGKWSITPDGVRPVETGYDRVIALGDRDWDNYEARLTVTTHDLLNVDPSGRDGGGFAIGMLWNGHTDTPIANWQPKSGYEPGAAFFYTDDNADGVGRLSLHPSTGFFDTLASKTLTLAEDTTYNLAVRVEQVGLYDRQYSIKIWAEGTPEPQAATLTGVQHFGLDEAPATGSLYLNAHYFDVAFGDVDVREIEGRDILQGTEGADVLMAVAADGAAPGRGEIDVLVGGAGADLFVLGDDRGIFYDDGDGGTSGTGDYAFVWDFEAGEDRIVLAGTADDYLLTTDEPGLAEGTAVWSTAGGGTPELIGLLSGVTGLTLEDENFFYDTPIA